MEKNATLTTFPCYSKKKKKILFMLIETPKSQLDRTEKIT